MQYISTRGQAPKTSAFEAILRGLAPDGGLYVPERLPTLDQRALDPSLEYVETARLVLAPFFSGDPLETKIPEICEEAFTFPAPIHMFNDYQGVLELYHGPTAAFKDFGARFLAAYMEKSYQVRKKDLMILVATSGDTGGAVAAAFHKRSHIRVKVIFPKGRVSARQELQLTCWGDNVESFALRGAFDDCQRLVKQAFMDDGLREQYGLTSANSINLGRLLPQSVYYVYAAARFLKQTGNMPVVVIPSGNVGNAVGAYWAKEMGAPIERIVLAVNANKTIPDFLATGKYEPRESIATIANAMDVGDPSNMERLRYLYPDPDELRRQIQAHSVSDEQIKAAMGDIWGTYGYAQCPHTAAGEYIRQQIVPGEPSIVAATAHPAKFDTIVEPVIGEEVPVPPSLKALLEGEHAAREIDSDLQQLFPDAY
ncbi:MAG: threonine synthase [Spirochaetota bacterium]